MVAEDKPAALPDTGPTTEPTGVIEFALPNFWRLIKQQKDLESPQIGFSHGFYFRILVHPRGTAGTDSESSHLSVFLEALKQPWFPDDWVFPNVRFDLTVVNWKDPKENVNSWAHWTFCEDTTSRGWQRMLPQSRISRARGFLNDEDTLLVRGKAEPVFWGPWSRRSLTFLPKNIWDSIPPGNFPNDEFSVAKKGRLPAGLGGEEAWDLIVPTLSPTLHCDALACLIHILFHIKEFRRLICAWKPRDPENSFISALQMVFARMHLWPLVICVTAEASEDNHYLDKPIRDLLATHNTAVSMPGSSALAALYAKQASCKDVLKALGLHCVQKMTFNDPFAELHQKIFTAIHEECELDYLADLTEMVEKGVRRDRTPQSLRLDRLLEQLLSINPVDLNQNKIGEGSYIHSYIKIRHVQSVTKALEANGKRIARFPDILAVYVSPQKTIRKGELFDVPLRLDASFMQASVDDEEESSSGSRKGKDRWYSLYALVIKDGDSGAGSLASNTSTLNASNGFSILIRPEEEGPWFRISDGRVEKLISKVSFAEWKCHRDFFSSVAIYVSEEFIDTSVPHPVDLRCLNPELYTRALSSFDLPPDYLDGILRDETLIPDASLVRQESMEFTSRLPATTDLQAGDVPRGCFSPFLSLYSKQTQQPENTFAVSPLGKGAVKLPEFPTLDKISKYGGASASTETTAPMAEATTSPMSQRVSSTHQQRFFDKVRSLLTDAITRRDATSLNAILAEVFSVSGTVSNVELDAEILSWTLREASKRALDVAAAVDSYLGSGLWEPAQPFPGGQLEVSNVDFQQMGVTMPREQQEASQAASNTDKTNSSLEDWVTRQVSIVWDLLARIDSYRQSTAQTKSAPFADVFCLAILESVEIRVLRNALLPQNNGASTNVPDCQKVQSETPKQHLRLKEKDLCLYALPSKMTDEAYRGAKRRCSMGAPSQACSATSSHLIPSTSSQPSPPAMKKEPSFVLGQGGNMAQLHATVSHLPPASAHPVQMPQSSVVEEPRSISQWPSQGGNYSRLLDLFQRSRPSRSKVVSICYGPIAASRRAHEATRRDLLRLKRRSCTDTCGIESQLPSGASACPTAADPVTSAADSKSVPSQGKRRRSETAGFRQPGAGLCAGSGGEASLLRLPPAASPSNNSNTKCRLTRTPSHPPLSSAVVGPSTSDVDSQHNNVIGQRPSSNRVDPVVCPSSDTHATEPTKSTTPPAIATSFSKRVLSPSLLALKAANTFDLSPSPRGSKRIKLAVTFESSLVGLRGPLVDEADDMRSGVLSGIGSINGSSLLSSSVNSEERSYLLLSRDVSCSTVYSLVSQALVHRLNEWKQDLTWYDGSSMLSAIALESAQRQSAAARAARGGAKGACVKPSWSIEDCESLFSLFLYTLSSPDGSSPTDAVNRSRSRIKVTFLNPAHKLSQYLSQSTLEDHNPINTNSLDLQLLVCVGGPLVSMEVTKPVSRAKTVKAAKKAKKKPTVNAVQTTLNDEKKEVLPQATAKDDAAMPLLIFKWFDCHEVDLFLLGAVPCDARLGLQDVIASWVLIRLLVYLPRLLEPFWNHLAVDPDLPATLCAMSKNPHEWKPLLQQMEALVRHIDMTSVCVVAEELFTPGNSCSRDFQNIRRFNSSIRKLNKKTGEIIVVQWKFSLATPRSTPPPPWATYLFKWIRKLGYEAIAEVLSQGCSLDEQSEHLWRLLYEEQQHLTSSSDKELGKEEVTHQQVLEITSHIYLLAHEKAKQRESRKALALTAASPSTNGASLAPEATSPLFAPEVNTDGLPGALELAGNFTLRVSPTSAPSDGKQRVPVIAKRKKKSVHHNRQWRHKGNSGGTRKASAAAPAKRKQHRVAAVSPLEMLDPSLNKDDSKSSTSSCSQSSLLAASLSPSSISSCSSSNDLLKGFGLAWKCSGMPCGRNGRSSQHKLILDLFKREGFTDTMRTRATVSDPSLASKFCPPKGLFLPQFRQCLVHAFELCSRATDLIVEDEILRHLIAHLRPLTAADLSSSQGWPAAEWASQLELLVRSTRSGLPSSFRTEFPQAFIVTLHLAILNAIKPDSAALSPGSQDYRTENEIDFFHSALNDNVDLLVMVELLGGLFSVSPTFGHRRSLQKLAFGALEIFYTLGMQSEEVPPTSAVIGLIEDCFEAIQAQLVHVYQVAISVCYTLFLTLYALPSIFSGGPNGRKFGHGLMRRLRNTFTFTATAQQKLQQRLAETTNPAIQEWARWNNRMLRSASLVMNLLHQLQGSHHSQSAGKSESGPLCDNILASLIEYQIQFTSSVINFSGLPVNASRSIGDVSTKVPSRETQASSSGNLKSRRWSRDVLDYSKPSTHEESSLSHEEDDEDDDDDDEEDEEEDDNEAASNLPSDSSSDDFEDEYIEEDRDFVDDITADTSPTMNGLDESNKRRAKLDADRSKVNGAETKKSRLRYAIARNRGAQDRSLASDGGTRRKSGRPSVYKDEPRVVRESRTWFVVFKPAFWHCSGPGQSTEHPIDLTLLREGQIEEATTNISLPKLQKSGRMESFHLWMMKKYPHLETVRKWTELECGLCHRIDLETSGALLIAKTHRSRDLIWEQFRRRYVHKEYLLLCHGRIGNRQGTVKTRLLTKDYGTNKSRRIKSHFTTVVAEGGEVALTEYHVCKVFRRKPWIELLQALRNRPQRVASIPRSRSKEDISDAVGNRTATEEYSLCKCRIITGRTHQIRVHMRHIGHPLVSDTKYLDSERCQEDRQWCPRMFLHAAALEFADPDAQPGTFTEAICPLAHELVQAMETALVCVDDFVNLESYGVDITVEKSEAQNSNTHPPQRASQQLQSSEDYVTE